LYPYIQPSNGIYIYIPNSLKKNYNYALNNF